MAKIYERLLSTIKLQENRRDSFDPQREHLLGEDTICMLIFAANTASDIFYYYRIDFLRLFSTRTFALSSNHPNQNVATIGTLLDQFMLSCK